MAIKGYALDRDYVSSPGEILTESLAAINLSPQELAQETQMSITYVEAVLHGKVPVTPEFSAALTRFFEIDAGFWLRLDEGYQYFKRTGREKQ